MNTGYSLTPEEVASILRIKKNTVYELIKRGELTAYRVGRKFRIDRNEVDNYKNLAKANVKGLTYNQQVPITAIQSSPPEPVSKIAGKSELIICGQDLILDILARHMERNSTNIRVLRKHVGSC